jgi:hypothetical protein
VPCFAHRVLVNSRYAAFDSQQQPAENILREILNQIAVPV